MNQLITPIGVVHSDIARSRDMPLQGVPAAIEIFSEYLEGLRGVAENTHITVIGWFDRAERGPLVVTPRKIRATNPALGRRGVFALRSPVRPNPLSLSVVRLLNVEEPLLYVEALDLIDASPIIDIKPYSAGWDLIFWARDKHSQLDVQDAVPEEACAALTREAYNFHGERCAATAAAARVIYDAAAKLESDPRNLAVALPHGTDPHLIDSLIGITRATPGNSRLSLCGDTTDIVISSRERSIGYQLSSILDWEPARILRSPSESLFQRIS